MLDIQTKLKRQLEIVGLAVENERELRPVDLAEMYGCEELTIKRDLSELRGSGIDVHSHRNGGVRIDTPIPPRRLRELVAQYLSLCVAQRGVDNAVGLMVRKRGVRALHTAVLLQRCIEQRRIAVIDYRKEAGDKNGLREIAPLLLFQSDRYWRVLAMHDDRIKQFHLNKIASVNPGSRRFRPVPASDIEALFRHSFKSWIGTEEYRIRLHLSPLWAQRLKPRQLFESQLVTEESDGAIVLEASVNSLDEIASWVVSRGEGVTVLDPPALREKVITLAQGVLRNYQV
ncbi:WYL domain-containing protein [bacterium]|nr:WYL domain-containing protein [bacterium]